MKKWFLLPGGRGTAVAPGESGMVAAGGTRPAGTEACNPGRVISATARWNLRAGYRAEAFVAEFFNLFFGEV